MRYLIILKASAGEGADAGFAARLGAFRAELARAGALLDASGLASSREGWRIRYHGERRVVAHGPFADAGPPIAGYVLIQARDADEALEWSRRFPAPSGVDGTAEIEVRPLRDADASPTESMAGGQSGL